MLVQQIKDFETFRLFKTFLDPILIFLVRFGFDG